MKKSIIASVVALGMVSGGVQASEQDVTFHGSVTTVTCDLDVTGDGINGNLPNMVDLGQAKLGDADSGKVVNFVFKPSQTAGNQAACDVMEANNTASLTWFGTSFDGNGLGKTSGTAEGASVKLMATNAKTNNNQPVTANGTVHEFSADKLKTGGDGLQYSAQLIPGTEAGSFEAVARYAFSYK
ncbi:fimbrial protein [Salmonella enterica subsp. enterica serovar Javiana]|nr:fimbrial protein [Salmonella enterica subsp. enterica serovar Javiana]ECV1375369.1 fimbrial protein [Salmonella enterica subsp. enterica serovar Javiana]EEI9041253.1 fimbrial protein [Salmonella enterica subsp. enterica serovar Javiana]